MKLLGNIFKSKKDVKRAEPKSVLRSDGPYVDPNMSFNLYQAVGGIIVEVGKYDKSTDRYNKKLYVISDDESDINLKVAKIITMENLRWNFIFMLLQFFYFSYAYF